MKPKKIALIGGAGFIGHNLAISLKNRGHEAIVIDSLAVNNILSFTDSEIKNRKLYSSILNQRMDLIHDNNIEINIEDARDYNAMSMLLGNMNLTLLFNWQQYLMLTNLTRIHTQPLIILYEHLKIHWTLPVVLVLM